MGCALMLVVQAFIHMLISVNLFPVTGQPLPLISRGGTSVIISCMYIGIILSVSYYIESKASHNEELTIGQPLSEELTADEEVDAYGLYV